MRADALSRKQGYVGAVAFSRTGDPATGDFSDATVIRTLAMCRIIGRNLALRVSPAGDVFTGNSNNARRPLSFSKLRSIHHFLFVSSARPGLRTASLSVVFAISSGKKEWASERN
jgi:hypothetical protein